MKEFLHIIKQTPLFHSIEDESLEAMLNCLNAQFVNYKKGSAIFLAGNPSKHIGLVLDGNVEVVRDDVFGNRTLLTRLTSKGLFGETFVCAGIHALPVSVIAITDCDILLLNYRQIITICPTSCSFHNKLIENMLYILAQKNLTLNNKIEILASRTIRDKLLSYLNTEATKAQSRKFCIPFNRQELADYLSVDRSALSREMGIMQQNGLIKFSNNEFELLESELKFYENHN